MEKAAVTGKSAGSRWEVPLGRCTAAILAACVVGPAAVHAQEAMRAPAEALAAEARAEQPLRLQVQTSSLPRMEAQDTGFQAPRVDVSLFPGRSHGVGAVLGMTGFSSQQQPLLGLQPMRPSVDFGLRFSHKLQSQHQIDVTAWRRMNAEDDAYTLAQMRQPVYGARVEMNLSSARKSPFALDRGFIGFQLESGARISVKRKDGRPMVYYRTQF
jgi:hypothetical protein